MIWLTGVDYFSTLGYQPGIALLAAGTIAPMATMALVFVTLFGALPVYMAVARRSYTGQGSVSMLEKLVPGWAGKALVLALLGFGSTAFVITMTLSAADAAAHAVENPYLAPFLEGHAFEVTCLLLLLLGAVFLKGASEAIGLATFIAIPYLILNAVVIGRGLFEVSRRPDLWHNWTSQLDASFTTSSLITAIVLAFPALALGMSGFETGVSVMPLVRGNPPDVPGTVPVARIHATRWLLGGAAIIMSLYLAGSSVVTTVLLPAEAWHKGGEAEGRALAWLAHHYLGGQFGTVYDISTIVILWFAGASAMAGLLSLIPQYLPRFGMAPAWVSFSRPLVLLLMGIDLIVTWAFDAGVTEQAGAYATGVLALILSAAIAVTLALIHEARAEGRRPWLAIPFTVISLVFVYTMVANIAERPDGLIISLIFILSILLTSAWSRYQRATEFRVEKVAFATQESERLWPEVQGRKVNFVTVKHESAVLARHKARIKQHYQVQGAFAFIHIDLAADRSAFDSTVYMRVSRLGDDYYIRVTNATAIANTIAYISELIDPRSIFLGLTRENPVTQAVRYLLWGEGETGILVYQILLRYWHWTDEDDVRPHIFLMSD